MSELCCIVLIGVMVDLFHATTKADQAVRHNCIMYVNRCLDIVA